VDHNTRIIEKIRKVLELSKRGVEGEAQLAAQRLQELLTAHNLEIADLETRGHKNKPGIKEQEHDLGKAAFKWKLMLADIIAEHYFCVSLVDYEEKTVKFVGRPDNVESLQMLYSWIIDQLKGIAREARRAHIAETNEYIDPLRWQVNFGLGAVGRLRERLRELKQKQAENVTETGLVVHHLAEVSDYLEQFYGFRKDGRRTKEQQEAEARWDKIVEEHRKRREELKQRDPEEFFRIYREPVTDEHRRILEKEEEKERKRRERNERRRTGRTTYRDSPVRDRREEQAWTSRMAGVKGADRVNLEPFIGDGGAKSRKGIE
jgi:hypothetical protein